MKINTLTKQQVMERMGSGTSDAEALAMIEVLKRLPCEDTSEIDDTEWAELVAVAVAEANGTPLP